MHDEPHLLPIWIRYYTRHFPGAVYILDHQRNHSQLTPAMRQAQEVNLTNLQGIGQPQLRQEGVNYPSPTDTLTPTPTTISLNETEEGKTQPPPQQQQQQQQQQQPQPQPPSQPQQQPHTPPVYYDKLFGDEKGFPVHYFASIAMLWQQVDR